MVENFGEKLLNAISTLFAKVFQFKIFSLKGIPELCAVPVKASSKKIGIFLVVFGFERGVWQKVLTAISSKYFRASKRALRKHGIDVVEFFLRNEKASP